MHPSLAEFAEKLDEIMPVIARGFALRQANELYKGKITLPQFLILDFLHRQGESKMSGLAHFMGVSTAAMTGTVERLVKYGYALRQSEPEDRRIIKIRLTPRGKDLVKKINHQRQEMVFRVFGKFSQADRQDYLRILYQIKQILSAQTNAQNNV